MEEWRNINEHYQVSNQGRVRSLDRTLHFNNGYVDQSQFFKGQILTHYKNKKGYHRVKLGSRGKAWFVHTLVAIAFKGSQPFDGWQVDHIDNDKENNTAGNMQWLPAWCNRTKGRGQNNIFIL